MAITTKASKSSDALLFHYRKKLAKEFHEEHKAEYESTSPWAITTKLPKLRIVDNVLQEGRGHTSPIESSTRVVRTGIFRKQAVSNVHGGGGSWSLKSKVQFDKVYMCPKTGREFTDADMTSYKDSLLSRCRAWVEDQKVEAITEPGTIGVTVRVTYSDGRQRIDRYNLEDLDELARSN